MAIKDDFLKSLGDEIIRVQNEKNQIERDKLLQQQENKGIEVKNFLEKIIKDKLPENEWNEVTQGIKDNTKVYQELYDKASTGQLTETEAYQLVGKLTNVTATNMGKTVSSPQKIQAQTQAIVNKALKVNKESQHFKETQNKARMQYEDLNPSKGINYREKQRDIIKHNSPLTHIANTRGFTSNAKIHSVYNGPDAPTAQMIPEENFKNTKVVYDAARSVNRSKIGVTDLKNQIVRNSSGKVVTSPDGNVQLDNYLVYDYETVGKQGTKTFAPTQVAFRGKVGGNKVEYNSFMQIDGDAKAYLEQLVDRMNSTDTKVSLTQSEKEQLMWLSDFRAGTNKNGQSVLTAVHEDRDASLPFSDIVKKQITEGFSYISGKSGSFINLKNANTVKTELLKAIGGTKGLANVLFAGNNISGFDNDLLVSLLGQTGLGKVKTLDIMSLAKNVFKRGQNIGSNQLYGFTATELARSFGVTEADISKIFLSEQGDKIGQELLSQLQGRAKVLTHSGAGDVIPEEKVLIGTLTSIFKNPKTASMLETGLLQSKTFTEGMVYKATTTRSRIHADEGAFDKNGNALTMDANAWNFRMSKKGNNISFGAIKSIGQGRFGLSYKDVDFGTEYLMTGNSVNEILDRVTSMVNLDKGKTMDEYQKSGEGQEMILNKLFGNSNLFMRVIENINDLQKLGNVKDSLIGHEQKATVEALLNSQNKNLLKILQGDTFQQIYEGLNNIGTRGNGNERFLRDLALKEIGVNMGAISRSSYSAEDILKYATTKAGANDFNSVKTQLRNFVNFASMGLDKETHANLLKMVNNATYSMGNNTLYGLAATISEALSNSGLNVDTNRTPKAVERISKTIHQTQDNSQMIKDVTAAYNAQFVDNPVSTMYEAQKNNNIGKALDGTTKHTRLKKMGVTSNGKFGAGSSGNDANFASNTMGNKLAILNEVAGKQGLQTTIVGSDDGKSLEVRLFNPKDVGSGNYSSVTIPIADENGDIFYKGMKRVDTMQLKATPKMGTNHDFDFEITTASETMLDNIIKYLGYTTPLREGQKVLAQQISEGNYESGNNFLRWLTDKVFETSGSLAEQKHLRELSDDDLEGGNAREMHAKRNRIEFKGAIDKVVKSLSGQIGNYSDSEISNFLLDYIYGTTYNMQDFIASINGDLGAAFAKDGKFSYLANSLTNIGRSLPQAQLESLKEAGYFLKQQINFGGARDLVAGADLNSMTKRAHTQIARVLNRVNANQSGTIQRIRSGHDAAKAINDYNTAEAMQFNIAGINDGIIKSFVDSEIMRLQKAGVTGDDAYLSELQKYQKTGMPSVHDDGVLLNQKYLANLESYQNANVIITDEMLADKNFQNLLVNMGYSVTDLQSIGIGDKLDITNKKGGLTEGEFAWGKKNSKAKHIMGKHDSFNYFVREESTGNLLMNYDKSIPMKEGIKLLAATTGGRHTINQIVSDTFMQRFASHIGMSGTDLTMLTEQKDMSKTIVPNAIATYEYILNEALTKGTITSGEQLQGILNDMGALGRYFTVQGSGKDMYVESLANIQTDGNGTDPSNPFGGSARYVDAKGNAIFNNTEEATKFLSADIAMFAKKMGVSLPNQGATIMRSRLGVANEHQWTRAIGFDTYENTEAYSPLQIDDKARQTILRSINNMMGVSQNSEAVEAYRKAWQQFGDQSKDPNYQKNVATAEAIQKAFKNALTNTNTIDVDKMGLYVPKDVSHIPISAGTGSEKGLYKVEDYKETPYAKLAQEAFNAGKDFISLEFEGMNLKLPTGMEGTRAYVDMNSVVLPVRPDFIKNGKFDLGTSQTMMTWEKRVGDLVRLKSLIDNGTLDAGSAYEQVQTTINNLYGDMFNSVWNKEGSINQAINKKRVGSSLVGTASGLNMLSEMEMDSQVGLGARRGYSDVSIGVENFKDQLRISQDLWKYVGQGYKDSEPNKQRLNMARTNLGYLYQSLLEDATIATQGKEHKALAEQVAQFKKLGLNMKTGQYNVTQENMEAIINNITTLTDISGDFGQFKLGIGGSLLRWPLTNDMGTPVVNMRADSSLDAKTIKINSGMAKLLNADFDSDKLYLAMHMMESSYADYAEFKKVLSGQRELMQQDQGRIKGLAQQMQVDYLSDNALFFVDEKGNRISKETYFKSSIEDRQKYRMLTNAQIQKLAENGDKEINKFFEGKQDKVGKTGNYLYNGITQDIVETLVAKRQFSHIGQFSNVNTGIRRAFDDIGLGAGTADGANQELVNKNRVTGFMINAFDEYLEQDSISAKKVAGLLDDIMKNDQLDAKGKRDAISRAVSSLSGAYKRYQASDYVASRDASQNVSYWQGVFSDLSNKFGVLSNDKGVQGRQFDLAIESLKSSGMTEDDIAKAMGFETASDIFSIDDFGVSRFALTPDKMVDALSRLYAHADSMSASTGSGKNLMSRRWNYIAEGKEATEKNVGNLINQAVVQAYKRYDYDAKYNTHNFQSKLVNSSLDTTGNKHEYTNTAINGIDVELSKIDDMHKVSVTQAGHWIQPYEEFSKGETYDAALLNMRNLWEQLSTINDQTKTNYTRQDLSTEAIRNLENAFVDPKIRESLFGDLKTTVFGSERGTAIHGIFEDIEKNFSGQTYENKEDFINALKTGKGYQEALERYDTINKRVQELGFTEKNIFGEKDIADLADYADLYRQHRAEFAKSGDIGVFAEKPMGMYFENADGQGFLMNGTADAITERGITDYKVKGKIDGVLESWQLNTLWRMKKANMNTDLAHMGHSLVGGEALTVDFIKKFMQSPDTDITKMSPLMREALGYIEGAQEPWDISKINNNKLNSYVNMLNNYTAGKDPLLTIKWFREVNGQKVISNLKFDEMDDETYSRLTNYVNSVVQKNPQHFKTWEGKAQIQDMIKAGFQLNTLNRKESVGYNEAGKEVNPFDPLDLLYGARVNDDVFDAYELATDKKTKDKILRNTKALETLGLKFTNEELDLKKNPELFNAYRNFVENRGIADQHTLDILKTHAINPDDVVWSQNKDVMQNEFEEFAIKAQYGNDVVEYYKESIVSGKENYFAGIKNIAGEIERVKFGGNLKFTEDGITGDLTDADKANLLKLEEFRHTHLSGALSPSSSDIKQLKQIYDYQLQEGKEVALKRFIIDTDKQSLTIDVAKIAQLDKELTEKGKKGFDWLGFAQLFNTEELDLEDLRKNKDFGKFLLEDSGVREATTTILNHQEQFEGFKVQNMVEALKNSGVDPKDLLSTDKVKSSEALKQGGILAERFQSALAKNGSLKVAYENLIQSQIEHSQLTDNLSKYDSFMEASKRIGESKLDLRKGSRNQTRAERAQNIGNKLIDELNMDLGDFTKQWKQDLAKELNGKTDANEIKSIFSKYATSLSEHLSNKAIEQAKSMGVNTSSSASIQTGIEQTRNIANNQAQSIAHQQTNIDNKINQLEAEAVSQLKYNMALEKGAQIKQKINQIERGEGMPGEEDIAQLREELRAQEKIILDEGEKLGRTDLKNQTIDNLLNKKANKNEQTEANNQKQLLKEGVSQFQTLQKMLSSNAPTRFTDSLANSLTSVAKQLGGKDGIEAGLEKIIAKMSTEQKIEALQQQDAQFNATLAHSANLDAKAYQLEMATTNYNRLGANTEKTSVVNPWKNKLLTAQKTAYGLEQAKIEADLHRQMDSAGDDKTRQQFADRMKLNEQIKETNRQFLDTQRNAMKGSQGVEKLAHSFKGMLTTAFQYGVVYRGAQALIQQIYTVIGSIKEFDSVETQLRMLKEVNKDTAAGMIADYRKIADEYGILTTEVANASVTFLRQGRNIADTNELIRQSSILAKVGFMEQTEAAELLTATLNGFKLEAKEAANVVDLVSYTDQIAATSTQELMTAFQYVASSANVAGFEVEKLNAMIATSSETTRLSASTIGQAYKTMVSRLQQVKIGSLVDEETGEDISNMDKMLKQYGINIMDINGKMKDGDIILEELAEKWKSWGSDTAKKREAVEALAGVRQGNIAMSLMDNWDRYEEILADTEANASGSAQNKMEVNAESIATSIARLQNTLKSLMSGEGATGLYKWVVDLTTGLVKMSPIILTVAGAFLLMKGNGAGLNAVYNIQTGLVEKLKTSYMSLAHAQEYQQMQAQKAIQTGHMNFISGGGMSAFIDPTTGQTGEAMDNFQASRVYAYQSDNAYKSALIKNGITDSNGVLYSDYGKKITQTASGEKQFIGNWAQGSVEGKIALARAAMNGQLNGVNGLDGSQYLNNVSKTLDNQVLAGNITDAQRAKAWKGIGYMADMGWSQEQINRGIAENLFTKGANGEAIFKSDTELEKNLGRLETERANYLKEHPDAMANTEENLVSINTKLYSILEKIYSKLNSSQRTEKSNNSVNQKTENSDGHKGVGNSSNRTKEISGNQNSVKETSNTEETLTRSAIMSITPKTPNNANSPMLPLSTNNFPQKFYPVGLPSGDFVNVDEQFDFDDRVYEGEVLNVPKEKGWFGRLNDEIKKRFELRFGKPKVIPNGTVIDANYQDDVSTNPTGTQGTSNGLIPFVPRQFDFDGDDVPQSQKQGWLKRANQKLEQSAHWQKHKQGYTVGAGMIGMMGGSMGGTQLFKDLGMSDSTSSMLGMGTGMGLQMLATTGPIGAATSAVVGLGLAAYKGYKDYTEKIKEETRQAFKEAAEGLKKVKEQLKEIEDIDFQKTFRELSQGVDEKGQNVSLSDEEYEQYREQVDKMLEANPSLIEKYNEEGEAIFDRNTLLEESIRLLKEENAEKRKQMYGDSTTNKTRITDITDNYKKDRDMPFWVLGNDNTSYISRKNAKDGAQVYGEQLKNGDDSYYNYLLTVMKHIDLPEIEGYSTPNADFEKVSTEEDAEKFYQKYKDSLQSQYVLSRKEYLEGKELYETKTRQEQIEKANEYKNIVSVTEGYDKMSDAQQNVLNRFIDNMDFVEEYKDYNDAKNLIDSTFSVVQNSGVEKALNSYFAIQETASSAELEGKRLEVLNALKSFYNHDETKTLEAAKGFGIIDKDFVATSFEEAAKYNKIDEELKEKINDQFGVESDEAKKLIEEMYTLPESTKKEINNNFKDLIIKPLDDGLKSLNESLKEFEKRTKTFADNLNLSWLTKNTNGISEFYELVKGYNEDLVLNENGKYEKLMTPEIIQGILKLQSTLGLDEVKVNQALSDSNGQWSLESNRVENLIRVMLEKAFEDVNFSLQDLSMFTQNLEAQGIVGAENIGYIEFLKTLANQGLIYFEEDGDLQGSKNLSLNQQQVFDAAKNAVYTESNKDNIQKLLSYTDEKRFVDAYAKKYASNEEDIQKFADAIQDVTTKLGGLSSILSLFDNSGALTTNKDVFIDIMNRAKSGQETDINIAANKIKEITGNNFEGADSKQIVTYGMHYLAQQKSELQYQLDTWDQTKIDNTMGRNREEEEELARQVRSAKRQLEDLRKEQKLDDVTLVIDKLQLSIDKLNKSMSTLGSIMDSIDAVDFAGKIDNISQQMSNANDIISTSHSGWETLNEDYEKAAAEGNGEAMQKIGEAMASYSDSITENSLKLLNLKKEASNLLVESATHEIEQIGEVTNRELKILELQRSGINSDKFNFFNTNLLSSPLNFLPNMEKSAIEKARDETNSIIAEENARQQRLNEIKEKSLEVIYENAKERRTDDIAEAERAYDKAYTQWHEKEVENDNAEATYKKEYVQGLIDSIDKIIEDNPLWLTIGIRKEGDSEAVVPEKGKSTIEKLWGQTGAAIFKNARAGQAKEFSVGEQQFKIYTEKSDLVDDEEKMIGKYNSDAIDKALENTSMISPNKENGSTDIGQYDGKREKEDGTVTYAFKFDGGVHEYTYEELFDVRANGHRLISKKVEPHAFSNSDTPISSGPITVAEHHPEFVMFKDGTGAIYDKTTILNGAEVDFVSDASYAQGGKSNGTPVSAYADGGNQSKAVETAKEVQEEISTSNEDVVTNVEETNAQVLTNITDTNTEIEKNITDNNNKITDTINISWQDNKKIVTDTTREIKTITENIFDETAKTVTEKLQKMTEEAIKFSNTVPLGGSDIPSKIEANGNPIAPEMIKRVSSQYGYRIHPVYGTRKFHDGMDIAADEGTPIGAIKDGIVTMAQWNGGYGNYVAIDHGDGLISFYGHMSRINTSVGAEVKSGDVIGLVGSTGTSTGNHLHLGMNLNGKSVDPSKYITGYDSGTINKDFSKYGIMSEKRGEYKINKQTGEWTYEPYETVVDTSKYDVVSGKDSQAIRSRQYDGGTLSDVDVEAIADKVIEAMEDNTDKIAENTEEIVKSNKYTVSTAGGKLNLRQESNTNSTILGSFANGTEVEVIKSEGDWHQVKVGDQEGWMHKDYLKQKETSTDISTGQITTENTQKTVSDWKDYYNDNALDNQPTQFLTDSFRKGYNDLTRVTKRNLNLIENSLQNTSTSISETTKMMEEHNDIVYDKNMVLTVNSLTSSLHYYYEQLDTIKELMPAILEEGDSGKVQAIYELYDEVLEKIQSTNDEMNNLVEEGAERYKQKLSIMLADVESVFIKLSEKIKDIDMQISMLNEWNLEDKVQLSWEKVINQEDANRATRNQLRTTEAEILDIKDFLTQGISKDLGLEIKKKANIDIAQLVDKLYNEDGSINQKQLTDYKNMLTAFVETNKGVLSTDEENLLVKINTYLANLETATGKQVELETTLDQGIQQLFQNINEAMETNKAQMEQEYEQRKSLYTAIVDNTSTIKELIDMEGQLLKETDYIGKAENMAQSYNASVNNVQALQQNEQKLRNKQSGLEDFFADYGFNIAEGFKASGEEVIGSLMAQQYRQWKEDLQQASFDGNAREISRLTQLISGYEMYGKVLVDQNENQQNLQSTLVSTMEAQKELIEQGKNYLQQYIEEMISQYKANTDTNNLISDRLSSIGDLLGKFNRDEELTIIRAQLINNANEKNNLLGQQSTVSNARKDFVSEMQKAIPNIDVNSLFTSKGEVMSSAYNEAKQSMDEMIENGEITLEQYNTWMQRIDQVGELKKQELEIEDQIIDNDKEKIQLAEEQINLIKEGYDWQITKMSSLLELTNKRFDTENKIFELRHDLDKELRSAKQSMQWLTKSERLKIFNEEDYTQLYQALDEMNNKTQAYYDDYYNQMMGLTEETLYQQEFITSEYERRMELVEAEYALTQKRVDLEKEQLKLKNVASEKSERMYVNGQWVQVANTEELISASEAVADAEKELELAEQEKFQKTQEQQMNSYIDALKRIQATLENTNEATSEAEEELIVRLTNSIEQLIGNSSSGGALQMVIDNLATDLHNYEQITGAIINVELKQAVETLAQVTNQLQEEINTQKESIKEDVEQISDVVTHFENELKLIDTDNVVIDLYNLGEAIKDVIRKFESFSTPEDEEDILSDSTKFNQEAYDIINNIVWYKKVWTNGNQADKDWAMEQAKPLYEDLKAMGYDLIANTLGGLNYQEALKLHDSLVINETSQWNSIVTDTLNAQKDQLINHIVDLKGVWNSDNEADKKWAEEQVGQFYEKLELLGYETLVKALKAMGYDEAIKKLNLKGFEKDASSFVTDVEQVITDNVAEESKITKQDKEIAEQNQDTAQVDAKTAQINVHSAQSISDAVNTYATNTRKFDLTTVSFGEGVARFTSGGETYSIAVDTMSNTVGIMTKNGEIETLNIENMGNFINEIPSQFDNVAGLLYNAIILAIESLKELYDGDGGDGDGGDYGGGYGGGGNTGSATAILPDGTKKEVVIGANGKTLTQGLPVGTEIHTKDGGIYKITGGTGGNYTSETLRSPNSGGGSSSNKPVTITPSNPAGGSNNIKPTTGTWKGQPVTGIRTNPDGTHSYMNGNTVVDTLASGTLSSEQVLANIDEIGKEIVIPSGRLRMMEYGDQVIPHNISENLLKWGTLNPALLRSLAIPEHTNNITTTNSTEINIDTIKLDNVTNGNNFLPELNRYMKRTNSLL